MKSAEWVEQLKAVAKHPELHISQYDVAESKLNQAAYELADEQLDALFNAFAVEHNQEILANDVLDILNDLNHGLHRQSPNARVLSDHDHHTLVQKCSDFVQTHREKIDSGTEHVIRMALRAFEYSDKDLLETEPQPATAIDKIHESKVFGQARNFLSKMPTYDRLFDAAVHAHRYYKGDVPVAFSRRIEKVLGNLVTEWQSMERSAQVLCIDEIHNFEQYVQSHLSALTADGLVDNSDLQTVQTQLGLLQLHA